MKKVFVLIVALGTCILVGFHFFSDNPAVDFLNSLDDQQKKITQLSLEDESRTYWHFFPDTMVDRAGIRIKDLSPEQKKLAFKLLENNLSEAGYDKTKRIIDLENVLAELDGDTIFRDAEKYHIAIYGNPEKDDIWAWSFEGHHVSLNFSIVNNNITIVPRFMGANPATIKSGKRKGERTLFNEEDLAIQLVNDLSKEQRELAIFQESSLKDIVTFNSSKVDPLAPVGIELNQLNDDQKKMLWRLINEYLLTMPNVLATQRMNNLKTEEVNEIRFGWAGSLIKSKPHYYRIQGKTFLIEFDNINIDANHIHTVWRDFTGDFGRDLIKEHYQKNHH